jgi:hypothetical protein
VPVVNADASGYGPLPKLMKASAGAEADAGAVVRWDVTEGVENVATGVEVIDGTVAAGGEGEGETVAGAAAAVNPDNVVLSEDVAGDGGAYCHQGVGSV